MLMADETLPYPVFSRDNKDSSKHRDFQAQSVSADSDYLINVAL